MFNEVITNSSILANRYIIREGYVFTSITHPSNIYDAIVINNVSVQKGLFQGFPKSEATLDEHIEYINKHHIEKALVYVDDLEFLKRTNTLKFLHIVLNNDKFVMDYTPLYELSEVKSLVVRREDFQEIPVPIDYSKVKGIEELYISGKGHINYEKLDTIKSLYCSNYKKKDLKGLFSSKILDSLSLVQCSLENLEGLTNTENLRCLYLGYNKRLYDINELEGVKDTLTVLRIENCSKIQDFSVLNKLEKLQLLELTGRNSIEDLSFIKHMKNLKTFVFSMQVLDGDLSPCLDLSYVYSEKNRKHYKLSDKDMPKKEYVKGNDDIELWRRWE